jgi:hypothetical protein
LAGGSDGLAAFSLFLFAALEFRGLNRGLGLELGEEGFLGFGLSGQAVIEAGANLVFHDLVGSGAKARLRGRTNQSDRGARARK